MKNKEYIAIGVTQDNDAGGHSRGSGHNTSRKCKAIKRTASKKVRQAMAQELRKRLDDTY